MYIIYFSDCKTFLNSDCVDAKHITILAKSSSDSTVTLMMWLMLK